MRLTDITEVRLICGGARIAVIEGKAPVTILPLDAENVFECTWGVEEIFEGERYGADCGYTAVGFDNGFVCTAGHSHRYDAEYFDAEEIAHNVKNGHLPPANARLMDGSRVY